MSDVLATAGVSTPRTTSLTSLAWSHFGVVAQLRVRRMDVSWCQSQFESHFCHYPNDLSLSNFPSVNLSFSSVIEGN